MCLAVSSIRLQFVWIFFSGGQEIQARFVWERWPEPPLLLHPSLPTNVIIAV